MFNVFAFLLRPPTWLYVLLTKLLFFFPPSPHFFLFFLLLSISSSPNVHAKYVCPIDSSFTRFLFFFFFSRIPNLPLRLLFCSLRARFRLGFLVQFFSTQRHSNILFSNRVFSLRVDSSEKQASFESGDSGGSAKRGRRRAWKCELSRNMLVYRINIRRAYPPWAEGEKEREEEGMGRGSLKPRNTETRNPLESLEFTARHIGCESTRN